MGRTLAEYRREAYWEMRNQGLSHQEVMEQVDPDWREQIEHDLSLSDFEAHFGINGFVALIVFALLVAVVAFSLIL